jgi:hypothetical protein
MEQRRRRSGAELPPKGNTNLEFLAEGNFIPLAAALRLCPLAEIGNQRQSNERKRMKTKLIWMKAVLAGLSAPVMILCGCSTVSVTTDYDHTANFANYRTYALEPPPKAPPLSPSADAALRTTLRQNLAARGITEVTAADKPDLAVVPHAKLQQKYSVEQYSGWGYGPAGWPYYGGYYGVWYGAPYTYSTINTYTEGTLILDFVDTSNQKLVFRGTGTGTVGSAESNAENIRQAVEKIVAKLPASTQPIAGNYESVTTAAAAP